MMGYCDVIVESAKRANECKSEREKRETEKEKEIESENET